MEKEKKNLFAFGYGLALLIPLFVTLRSIDHGLNIWGVFGLFVPVMFIITKMVLIKPVWNIWVLLVQLYIFALAIKQGFSGLALIFLSISILILLATLIKVDLLNPAYVQWMKIAHFIGGVIAGAILSILFYVVFGFAGILLRIMGKDLLDQKIDRTVNSYWVRKDQIDFDKKNYERQF